MLDHIEKCCRAALNCPLPPPVSTGAGRQQQAPPPAAPEFVPLPEDITILTVLAAAGQALRNADIVRDAAALLQEKRKARQKTRLILVSETVLGDRIPLLLDAGLVARPLGSNGKPMERKGVGITDKGREFLKRAPG
jgi:hypothetical protein